MNRKKKKEGRGICLSSGNYHDLVALVYILDGYCRWTRMTNQEPLPILSLHLVTFPFSFAQGQERWRRLVEK